MSDKWKEEEGKINSSVSVLAQQGFSFVVSNFPVWGHDSWLSCHVYHLLWGVPLRYVIIIPLLKTGSA